MYTMSIKQRQSFQETRMRRQLIENGIINPVRERDTLAIRPDPKHLIYVIAPNTIIFCCNKEDKPKCPKEFNRLKLYGSLYPTRSWYSLNAQDQLLTKVLLLTNRNKKYQIIKKFVKHCNNVVSEYWRLRGYTMGTNTNANTGESYLDARYRGKAFARLVLPRKEVFTETLTREQKNKQKRINYRMALGETYSNLADFNPLHRLKHSNYTFTSPYNDIHGFNFSLSSLTKAQWFNVACLDHSATSGGKHQSDVINTFRDTL